MNKPEVIVLIPAYGAIKATKITYEVNPHQEGNQIILVGDGRTDKTLGIALELHPATFAVQLPFMETKYSAPLPEASYMLMRSWKTTLAHEFVDVTALNQPGMLLARVEEILNERMPTNA